MPGGMLQLRAPGLERFTFSAVSARRSCRFVFQFESLPAERRSVDNAQIPTLPARRQTRRSILAAPKIYTRLVRLHTLTIGGSAGNL